MRALCGAIISAGAMIGLGLTAIGYGLRFQAYGPDMLNPDSRQLYGILSMTVILVVLLVAVVIGIGAAFLGLAFHHERRNRERLQGIGPHSHAA